MLAAHRGGSLCNPEHTMLAYRESVHTYGADVLEGDLRLTKDGQLVFMHDPYIDEKCNVNGDISLEEVKALCEDEANRHYVSDMTLEELEQYNFGYYFEDANGERIYKDVTEPEAMGLQIMPLETLLGEFYETHPDLLFILEIKDSDEMGKQACKVFDETLAAFPQYRDRIVIGTFHDMIEEELEENYAHLLRGAAMGTASKFVASALFGANLLDQSDFACLQIPTSYDFGVVVDFDKPVIINTARRRNVAVQYWTINDAEQMRSLIELGCDCLMTDDPALMKEILEEYR